MSSWTIESIPSFCITLERRNDRWKRFQDQSGIDSLDLKRFLGVDGKTIDLKTDQRVTTLTKRNIHTKSRRSHEELDSIGGVGCALSHIAVWQWLVDSNHDMVLVFEDDIEFIKNFENDMTKRLQYIPTDYDLLFLDVADCFDYTNVNKYFKKIDGLFFGMHSYIITDNAARVLLPRIFPVELQIDSYVSYMGNLSDLNMYYTEGLTDQSLHISSIQTICVNCDAKQQVGKLHVIFLFVTSLLVIFLLFTFLHVYSFHRNKLISN
jgi:GR25 family glycosyltransferase involved in LPS biosynthesis